MTYRCQEVFAPLAVAGEEEMIGKISLPASGCDLLWPQFRKEWHLYYVMVLASSARTGAHTAPTDACSSMGAESVVTGLYRHMHVQGTCTG